MFNCNNSPILTNAIPIVAAVVLELPVEIETIEQMIHVVKRKNWGLIFFCCFLNLKQFDLFLS